VGARKATLRMLFVLTIVFVSFPQIKEVNAQATIYIKGDGSIEGTDKIVQLVYDTYTFTDNIFGEIKVQRSNFVLDGAGYTLQGNWSGFYPDVSVESRGITLSDRSNITIKNLRITNFTYGINCVLSNNNTITNCYIEYCQRSINQPSNVLIANNTILCGIYLDYTQSNNTITQNNFISKDSPAANLIDVYFAPQPTVYMNYWSDYNGTDINGDGIGETPYVINQDNQDDFPLITQVDIGIIPEFPSWTILPSLIITTLVIVIFRSKFQRKRFE